MAILPNEILHIIVDILGSQIGDEDCRKALAGLRYINPYLRKITAPYLFSTLSMWLSDQSLRKIREVGRDPVISKCVKKLVVSPLIFRKPESRTELAKLAMITSTSNWKGARTAGDAYKRAWSRFYREQQTLARNSLLFAEATAPFTEVTAIEIPTKATSIGAKQLHEALGSTLYFSSLEAEGLAASKLLIPLIDAFAAQLESLAFTSQYGQSQKRMRIRHQDKDVGRPEEEHNLAQLLFYRFINEYDTSRQFIRLSELVIDSFYGAEEYYYQDYYLQELFRHTPHLQSFSIGSPGMVEDEINELSDGLAEATPDMIPELREIHVAGFDYWGIELLVSRSAALQVVRMIRLDNFGRYEIFLWELAEETTRVAGQTDPWPNLREFVLDFRPEGGQLVDATAYLKGITTEFPKPEGPRCEELSD